MIEEFLDINEDESIEALCERLGHFLGIGEAVEPNVLLRAIDDPSYAKNLLVCRNTPGFLMPLLNDPRNQKYQPTLDEPNVPVNGSNTKEFSNIALAKKASLALLNWGKSGFTIVDEITLKRREDACLGCPNLNAPKKLLQKLVGNKATSEQVGKRLGNSVCNLCGCNLKRKIRLSSEFCPDQHPDDPTMTRWLEPVRN